MEKGLTVKLSITCQIKRERQKEKWKKIISRVFQFFFSFSGATVKYTSEIGFVDK